LKREALHSAALKWNSFRARRWSVRLGVAAHPDFALALRPLVLAPLSSL